MILLQFLVSNMPHHPQHPIGAASLCVAIYPIGATQCSSPGTGRLQPHAAPSCEHWDRGRGAGSKFYSPQKQMLLIEPLSCVPSCGMEALPGFQNGCQVAGFEDGGGGRGGVRGDGVQHAGLGTLIPWGRTPRIQTSATAGLGRGNAAVLELSGRQQHSTFCVQPSGQPSGEASPFSKATRAEAVLSHQGEVQRGRCPPARRGSRPRTADARRAPNARPRAAPHDSVPLLPPRGRGPPLRSDIGGLGAAGGHPAWFFFPLLSKQPFVSGSQGRCCGTRCRLMAAPWAVLSPRQPRPPPPHITVSMGAAVSNTSSASSLRAMETLCPALP